MPLTNPQDIAALLERTRTIALVGISDRPDRPSYGVMAYLQDHGYRVLPVNPQLAGEHVHGEFIWGRLSDIGVPIDMVDIFRRSEAAGPDLPLAALSPEKARARRLNQPWQSRASGR